MAIQGNGEPFEWKMRKEHYFFDPFITWKMMEALFISNMEPIWNPQCSFSPSTPSFHQLQESNSDHKTIPIPLDNTNTYPVHSITTPEAHEDMQIMKAPAASCYINFSTIQTSTGNFEKRVMIPCLIWEENQKPLYFYEANFQKITSRARASLSHQLHIAAIHKQQQLSARFERCVRIRMSI
jgi:hypothetical protein